MKYFVLGAIASGALLYGMSLIYGLTGTLDLARIAAQLHAPLTPGLVLGLTFIVVAVAFKLGAVPFHMWLPDVYEGAPTSVTLFIGTAPKLAYFALALRLLAFGLPGAVLEWSRMLAVLAVLTLIVGNVVAIVQSNLKRMLAYSTIAHMGFMLLGLLSGVVGGNRLSAADAYSAALFYVIVYVIMTLGAFGMLVYLSRAGFECERLEDLRGLNRRSPWLAFLMAIVMFSLAGIPPTAGFYAKLAVFSAAVNAGWIWLAVAGVMLSLVGAFYYLRIVKLMYFDEAEDQAPLLSRFDTRVLLSLNGLSLLFFGIFPQQLMGVCVVALTHSY
jgi:NADH-quinone oxidoreductase subunit N